LDAVRQRGGPRCLRGEHWTLGAWCRLWEGFRNFRLDRLADPVVTSERFEDGEGRELNDFLRVMSSEC